MKKALSLFLVVLMLVGMLPMVALNANAAEVSESISLAGSTGTVSGESISWTSGNLSFTANKNTSSTAIRTTDTDHFRLYVGFSATLTCSAGNITKIVMTATGSSYAIAPTGADGSVGTVSGTTITIVPNESSDTYTISSITKQTRIKSITVTYATVDSGECAHANIEEIAAVAATCTTAGNTAGTKCADCGTVLSGNETIEALGHTNDEGVVTAPTCTNDGFTLYTCTVCGSTKKDDYVDATGHNYVDGVCSVCSVAMPTGLDGKYYIAAIRSSGNYFYMTNDLGTASTKRYQIVDSGLTELPASIETPVDAQIFELIFDASTATYKIKTGDQYLGWTSGNSGALVDEETAIAATIEAGENGAYQIHFTASDAERYLSLNSNAANAYYAWYKLGQVSNLYLVPVSGDVETGDSCLPGECVYENGVCINCGSEDPEAGVDTPDETEPEETEPTNSEATIDFSTTDQRTSFSTEAQVWSNDGATVTNNKASSTSNVADYKNPARFYKSSDLIIAFPGMTKIVITGDSSSSNKYFNPLLTTLDNAGVGYNVSGAVVTIEFADPTDSLTLSSLAGQIRMYSITVYAESSDHEHQWSDWTVTKEATCITDGEKSATCSVCGDIKTETIQATGHTYDENGNCTVCLITPAEVVAKAYALEAGAALEGTYTLTGVISAVNTPYDSSYNNVSVTIDVIGVTDMPIMCFRMKGEGADVIGSGDTITVTGILKNYNGTIEFDAGCTLDSWEDTGSDFVRPTTPEEIVNAAYALEAGASLEGGTYTLTGVITGVRYCYSASYNNITVTIQIGDMADKTIECYRLEGEGINLICVGDTITVTGNLNNYNGTIQFAQGSTMDSYEIKNSLENGHTVVVDEAVAATCTATGLTEGSHCSACTLVFAAQEETAALGHSFANGSCSVCGEADPDYTGPAIDENLKFNQKGIAFKDYVGLQFILSKTVASNYDSVYVDVVHSMWKDGAIVDTPVEIVPAEFSSAYRFEQEIQAWSMNEQVSVTLYGEKDGVVYQGESFTTSVAALALEKIAAYDNAGNASACTALVDMLNYGAAVQTGYSHNAESLPNANLGEYASKATAEDPTFAAVNSQSGEGSVAIYRDSISMQAKVEMQVIFDVDVSAYELRYTVNGVTTIIPSSEFTVTKFTKVVIGIPASNMRAEYQIALYDPATGEAVTPVLTRTVEAYAKAALGGTYNDVVIAMLKYGDSIAAL